MIQSLKLKNFRNFHQELFHFNTEKTFIFGENGQGKTNILEALSLLTGNSLLGINFEHLIQEGHDLFFIEYSDNQGNNISLAFDKNFKKKIYKINGKNTTHKFIQEHFTKSVIFAPIIMNMMYLSPTLRRDFLDNILSNSYKNYPQLLKKYKHILQQRNKLLKNIREQKSKREEISFWNQQFITLATQIYAYRIQLIDFIEKNIQNSTTYFHNKIKTIHFVYDSKIESESLKNQNQIAQTMQQYLTENFERDIILGTTHIGPHIDDFHICIDNKNLIEYASRGETKSIILSLKLIEIHFLEEKTQKKPILLIDDLLSELDNFHKTLLLEKIENYQTFITSIEPTQSNGFCIKL